MSARITIITPVFNGAAFLAETAASVLAQTHQDFEYLIVDDGSTDGTPTLAAAIAAQDPRCRVLRLERNGGLAAARNAGVRAATTPLVAFLDSDDIWRPEFLERQLQALEGAPQAVGSFCRSSNFQTETDRWLPTRAPTPGLYDWKQMLFRMCPPGNGSSLLLKRAAIEQAGFFQETLKRSEDTEMWIRMTRLSPDARMVCIADVLLERRKHGSSLTSSFGPDDLAGYNYICRTLGDGLHTYELAWIYARYMLNLVSHLSPEARRCAGAWQAIARTDERLGRLTQTGTQAAMMLLRTFGLPLHWLRRSLYDIKKLALAGQGRTIKTFPCPRPASPQ